MFCADTGSSVGVFLGNGGACAEHKSPSMDVACSVFQLEFLICNCCRSASTTSSMRATFGGQRFFLLKCSSLCFGRKQCAALPSLSVNRSMYRLRVALGTCSTRQFVLLRSTVTNGLTAHASSVASSCGFISWLFSDHWCHFLQRSCDVGNASFNREVVLHVDSLACVCCI